LAIPPLQPLLPELPPLPHRRPHRRRILVCFLEISA